MITSQIESNKSKTLIQPYLVGSKNAKSTTATIPKWIVKLFNITPSTVFLIEPNKEKRRIIMQIIDQNNNLKYGKKMSIGRQEDLSDL
jgi:hypothetical protein